MTENTWVYQESLTSKKTTALFLGLSILSASLCVWHALAVRFDLFCWFMIFLTLFFIFYTINYQRLDIRLSSDALKLNFGVFHWRVPLEKISDFKMDDQLSLLARYGGAGIHFMFVGTRYRASFNFLEYPRIVISFKQPIGPIKDLSFSSRQPQKLLTQLHNTIIAKKINQAERMGITL